MEVSTIKVSSLPNRIERLKENFNADWRTFLFYGSIGNDVFNLIFSQLNNVDVKVFWFPLEKSQTIRGRCNELKLLYGDKIKIFPGEITYQFRVSKPFDLIYWNGKDTFEKIKTEINQLYRHSSTKTQWIFHHTAPHRRFGCYRYGYIRYGVEQQFIKVDNWFEESSHRGVYDEAWCWLHFTHRPPIPDKIDNNAWDMSIEGRLHTGTTEWIVRERKVAITKWSKKLEKASTADDYEELSKELEQIYSSKFDEVDEWAIGLWNKSPGSVIRQATLKLITN